MNISISTFNLCNLQRSGQEMFGSFSWTPVQYQRKVGWIAEQLRTQPSTLFCFQEVWNGEALQDVFNTAQLADSYYLVCHESCDSMNVAIAVQKDWEIISTEWITAFPPELVWRSDDTRYEITVKIDRFSRPLLKVRLRAPDGRTLSVFNTHLKSRLPIPPNFTASADGRAPEQINNSYYGAGTDHWLDIGRALAGMRRLAEAAVLRLLVNRQLAQSTDAVIVAGDCNDRYPGNVLDVLKGDTRFRRSSKNRSGRRADWGLYHLLDLAADRNLLTSKDSDYITFSGEDEQLALDHLLFSWHFHARAADYRWRLHEWNIDSKHLGSGKPYVSDHAMVTAHFAGCGR
jgi:endonuclease/exonuclease/phosphatase family metal-dependent hydrolase